MLITQHELNLQLRIERHEIRDQGAKLDRAERHRRIHPQETAWGRSQMRGRLICRIKVGQDCDRALEISSSVLSRTCTPGRPIEQLNAEIVLEIGDIFADGGAREPQLSAGFGEASKFDESPKARELVHF